MGSLTLSQFRGELLFDLKNRTDTNTVDGFSTARQDLFINAGYLHVTHPSVFRHRELQHSFTIPLVNGQQGYTFDPDPAFGAVITAIRSVSHVFATTDSPTAFRTKLLPKDEQWFQERSVATGAPREYFVRGNLLLLGPVPGTTEAGQVLVVSAWREPILLTADSQVTVLSTRWDEIVLLAARWRAELHLGYRDLAEATKLDFVSLINEYKDFEQLHGEDWDWSSEVRTESAMERV